MAFYETKVVLLLMEGNLIPPMLLSIKFNQRI